jgi:chromosome segregation ATPase
MHHLSGLFVMAKCKSKPSAKKSIRNALRHLQNVKSNATDAEKRQTAYTDLYKDQLKEQRTVSQSTMKKWSKEKRRINVVRKNIKKLKKEGETPSWDDVNQLLDTLAVTESIVDETHTSIHNTQATENRLFQKHGRICQSFSNALDSIRMAEIELEAAQQQVGNGGKGASVPVAATYGIKAQTPTSCYCDLHSRLEYRQTFFPKDSKAIKLKRGRSKKK